MEKEQTLQQINFRIQKDIHTAIKMLAAERGISMNLWIMRAIYRALYTQRKD